MQLDNSELNERKELIVSKESISEANYLALDPDHSNHLFIVWELRHFIFNLWKIDIFDIFNFKEIIKMNWLLKCLK
jgi:hypothetical protein